MREDKKQELARLAQTIQQHPALFETEEEREKNGRKNYLELCSLLLRYFSFDRQLAKSQQEAARCSKEEQPLEMSKAETRLLNGNKGALDNVAFMEAYAAALKSYKPENGAFLPYFNAVYHRWLNRSTEEQYRITQRRVLSIGEKKARQIKQLLTMMRDTGRDTPDSLPRELYPRYAALMGMSEERFRELLQLAIEMNAANPSVQTEDGEETDFLYFAADAQANEVFLQTEKMESLCVMLELLADIEKREYPRLFLTNCLLQPLKNETLGDDVRLPYIQAVLQKEDLLWKKIWILAYIRFVFEPTPIPDSVKNILQGKLCRPLIDKSIAEYKQVSPSAVSQSSRTFWKNMRSGKLQRIEQLLTENS